ncbi:hypothetical protein HK102_002622, partial [Quaeritorhiza haematococci]
MPPVSSAAIPMPSTAALVSPTSSLPPESTSNVQLSAYTTYHSIVSTPALAPADTWPATGPSSTSATPSTSMMAPGYYSSLQEHQHQYQPTVTTTTNVETGGTPPNGSGLWSSVWTNPAMSFFTSAALTAPPSAAVSPITKPQTAGRATPPNTSSNSSAIAYPSSMPLTNTNTNTTTANSTWSNLPSFSFVPGATTSQQLVGAPQPHKRVQRQQKGQHPQTYIGPTNTGLGANSVTAPLPTGVQAQWTQEALVSAMPLVTQQDLRPHYSQQSSLVNGAHVNINGSVNTARQTGSNAAAADVPPQKPWNETVSSSSAETGHYVDVTVVTGAREGVDVERARSETTPSDSVASVQGPASSIVPSSPPRSKVMGIVPMESTESSSSSHREPHLHDHAPRRHKKSKDKSKKKESKKKHKKDKDRDRDRDKKSPKRHYSSPGKNKSKWDEAVAKPDDKEEVVASTEVQVAADVGVANEITENTKPEDTKPKDADENRPSNEPSQRTPQSSSSGRRSKSTPNTASPQKPLPPSSTHDGLLDIHPSDYYEPNGVPIFTPTWSQFRDFNLFMRSIDSYGRTAGIVKIIPPPEWYEHLPLPLIARNLNQVRIRRPIVQEFDGGGLPAGAYRQMNIESRRTYGVRGWYEVSNEGARRAPVLDEGGNFRGNWRAVGEERKPPRKRRRATMGDGAAGRKTGEDVAVTAPPAEEGLEQVKEQDEEQKEEQKEETQPQLESVDDKMEADDGEEAVASRVSENGVQMQNAMEEEIVRAGEVEDEKVVVEVEHVAENVAAGDALDDGASSSVMVIAEKSSTYEAKDGEKPQADDLIATPKDDIEMVQEPEGVPNASTEASEGALTVEGKPGSPSEGSQAVQKVEAEPKAPTVLSEGVQNVEGDLEATIKCSEENLKLEVEPEAPTQGSEGAQKAEVELKAPVEASPSPALPIKEPNSEQNQQEPQDPIVHDVSNDTACSAALSMQETTDGTDVKQVNGTPGCHTAGEQSNIQSSQDVKTVDEPHMDAVNVEDPASTISAPSAPEQSSANDSESGKTGLVDESKLEAVDVGDSASTPNLTPQVQTRSSESYERQPNADSNIQEETSDPSGPKSPSSSPQALCMETLPLDAVAATLKRKHEEVDGEDGEEIDDTVDETIPMDDSAAAVESSEELINTDCPAQAEVAMEEEATEAPTTPVKSGRGGFRGRAHGRGSRGRGRGRGMRRGGSVASGPVQRRGGRGSRGGGRGARASAVSAPSPASTASPSSNVDPDAPLPFSVDPRVPMGITLLSRAAAPSNTTTTEPAPPSSSSDEKDSTKAEAEDKKVVVSTAGGDESPDMYTPEYCKELERFYWRNLVYGAPMYGADMMGTLFAGVDEEKKEEDKGKPKRKVEDSATVPGSWNLGRLDNLLTKLNVVVPGVNSPYLYWGMFKATFAWHVEDMDLYSINYIHFGAPKQWYVIPPGHHKRFERIARGIFSDEAKECPEFLRHKTCVLSPRILTSHSLPVYRMVQKAGEFIVTYPHGYHSGYNLGFNCAESVNFALESWIEIGKQSGYCQCVKDSVTLDVRSLLKSCGMSQHLSDDEDADGETDDELVKKEQKQAAKAAVEKSKISQERAKTKTEIVATSRKGKKASKQSAIKDNKEESESSSSSDSDSDSSSESEDDEKKAGKEQRAKKAERRGSGHVESSSNRRQSFRGRIPDDGSLRRHFSESPAKSAQPQQQQQSSQAKQPPKQAKQPQTNGKRKSIYTEISSDEGLERETSEDEKPRKKKQKTETTEKGKQGAVVAKSASASNQAAAVVAALAGTLVKAGSSKKCELCPSSVGELLPAAPPHVGKWVHRSCAMGVPETWIEKVEVGGRAPDASASPTTGSPEQPDSQTGRQHSADDYHPQSLDPPTSIPVPDVQPQPQYHYTAAPQYSNGIGDDINVGQSCQHPNPPQPNGSFYPQVRNHQQETHPQLNHNSSTASGATAYVPAPQHIQQHHPNLAPQTSITSLSLQSPSQALMPSHQNASGAQFSLPGVPATMATSQQLRGVSYAGNVERTPSLPLQASWPESQPQTQPQQRPGQEREKHVHERVCGLEIVPKGRWALKCEICKHVSAAYSKQGACIQCFKGRCVRAFHVTCLEKMNMFVQMKEDANLMECYCSVHDPRRDRKQEREKALADIESQLATGKKVIVKRDGCFYEGSIKEIDREVKTCLVSLAHGKEIVSPWLSLKVAE